MQTRHIIRRVPIGCRVSPDTAVIVFCRGSPCPWHELGAVERSGSTANDHAKTVLLFFGNEQVNEESAAAVRTNRSGGFSLDQTHKTSADQGKDHSLILLQLDRDSAGSGKPRSSLSGFVSGYHSPSLFQPRSAKCPAWRTAAGPAPVHLKSKLNIHPERTG